MTRQVLLKITLSAAVVAAIPLLTFSQSGDRHNHPPASAAVDFGVLATAPLGPLPCIQVAPFGGPNDPCSYKLHNLTPEEVTIRKDGEVTFQIHGGGHAMAIYEVSKNTRRDQVGQYLCAGVDPGTITDPAQHVCNGNLANANAPHNVLDGRSNLVIQVAANITNAHPDNRVWYVPDRLMSTGAHQFLNGGTTPAGPASNGQLVTYQFLKTGRYLVICANRSHFLNDWMFGFVNVQ